MYDTSRTFEFSAIPDRAGARRYTVTSADGDLLGDVRSPLGSKMWAAIPADSDRLAGDRTATDAMFRRRIDAAQFLDVL